MLFCLCLFSIKLSLVVTLRKTVCIYILKPAGNLITEIQIDGRNTYVEFEELGSLFQWMEL